MIPFLLLLLLLSPIACGPTASTPKAVPAGPVPLPPTIVERVWASRPRDWRHLRVGLTRLPERPILTVKPAGAARLIDGASERVLARVGAGAPVMLSAGTGDTVRFETKGAAGTVAILRLETGGELRLEGRRLTGTLFCWRSGERVVYAVDLPIESYLQGVVPGEVPASWPIEAQKALAVAARTYAQASRGKHAAEGFDVCDGTHCQMYLGRVGGAARSERAVRETRGLVALSDGQLIRAFYSADCGGRTANNEDVPFPDNPIEPQPYLRSVGDAPWPGGPHYCARSSHHRWTRTLSTEQIETALNADPETAIGTLRDLRITEVDASGRAKTVQVDGLLSPDTEISRPAGTGEAGSAPRTGEPAVAPPPGATPPGTVPPALLTQPVTRTLAGYAFRRAIGPRLLKSTWFTLTRVDATHFRVTGAGYGHGVGLCQIGARGMASPPYRRSFRQILAHYYRGVKIAPFHPTGQPS